MGLFGDALHGVRIVRNALTTRRLRSRLTAQLESSPALPAGRFRIGVYFADGKVNLYQMRQWYEPLAELSKTWPVLILSRSAGGATAMLEEAPVPTAYVRTVADLERTLVEQDLRIILYVNQNTRNFQMMRYGARWHVFINHGESDKMYMTTNQFKAYDYALVAGQAAISRLKRVLWDYDFDKRALEIGRPQADHFTGDLPYPADERMVVLYAPTWEGDRQAAAYGSIASHGVALVEALIATGRHRVVYRPHPRSGVVDAATATANAAIKSALLEANRRDPAAVHVVDEDPRLGWQLSAPDVAIVDISAMVYDRLAAGKPLLVTRPVAAEAEIDLGGYLGDAEWLDAPDAAAVVARLDEAVTDDAAADRLARWVRWYFGDTAPGVATTRFHAAIAHLMAEWDRFAAEHVGDPRGTTADASDDAVDDRSDAG